MGNTDMKPHDENEAWLIWSAIGLAALLPFVGSYFYFVVAGDSPVARAGYAAVKVFTVLWPILVIRLLLKRPVHFRRSSRISLKRSLVEGMGVGLGLGALILGVLESPLGEMVRHSADSIAAKVDDLGIRSYYWIFALALSFGHSLLEEYYWRGFVFGQMRERMPVRWAHGLAGCAFALHHMIICSQYFPVPWGLVLGASVAVGWIIWSFLYVRHGHFWGAWLSHMIVDLVLVSIGYQLISA